MNKIFGGRYEVLEQIGSGGMAIVYKAKDALLNRIVTIKVLREQFVSDEDFIRRFRREAQAAASLSHPNIVSIYDVGKDGDAEYIVMEYVEGRNLKEIIREYAPVSQEQALYLARQIGEAISHAHAHNIIHRDIKPHNILITADGRAKVTDFGIARAVSAATVTHTGNIVGSVHYLSPEQAKGIQSNEQSDIYSLGIILYELLTGKVPYDGETAISIALKHLQENAVSPRKLNPRISPELEMVIMRAIAKSPEQRYLSAREMLDDLEKVRLGQPVSRPNFAVNQELEMTQIHRPLVANSPPLGPQIIPKGPVGHGGEEAAKVVKTRRLSKKARARIILSAIAAGLLIVLIGGGVWLASYMRVDEVTVPDLTNLTTMQATLELEKNHLKLSSDKPQEEFNSEVPQGMIISQDPKAEDKVKINREISVVLSKGPERINFPNLKSGYDEQKARDLLTAMHFTGEISIQRKPSSAPEGQVIDQDPAPDAQWPINGKVTLWLSSGSGGQVNMPNVVSWLGSDAEKELSNTYGLVVSVETADSVLYPKDVVVETRPAPGDPVKKGDTVTLVISRGPGPPY